MQTTSDLYQELLASNARRETRLVIGESDYDESMLVTMDTSGQMFGEDTPTVGCCVSGEINIEMIKPLGNVPRQARLVPYVRLTDGTRHSEWIQKGVYFIDTREEPKDGSTVERIVIKGYDAMLKTEQDYPASTLQWPARDIDVVREIAKFIGVALDARTVQIMIHGYLVQYPSEYSCREVLGYVAAMYGGCFIMSDLGELRLVCLWDIPAETRYLIDSVGQPVTFGGVRILV